MKLSNEWNEFVQALVENNFPKLEELISTQMKRKISEGWKIKSNITYMFSRHECCPLGSFIDQSQYDAVYLFELVQNLGGDFPNLWDKIRSIAHGFDFLNYSNSDHDFWILGQKLADQAKELQNMGNI